MNKTKIFIFVCGLSIMILGWITMGKVAEIGNYWLWGFMGISNFLFTLKFKPSIGFADLILKEALEWENQ